MLKIHQTTNNRKKLENVKTTPVRQSACEKKSQKTIPAMQSSCRACKWLREKEEGRRAPSSYRELGE